MQVLQGPRRSGKTTDLIKASALTGAVIVTSSKSTVDYIRKMARDLGLAIPMPLLYRDILEGSPKMHGRRPTNVLIDDLDLFFKNVTTPSLTVVGATLTPTTSTDPTGYWVEIPEGSGWKHRLIGKQGDVQSYEQFVARQYE